MFLENKSKISVALKDCRISKCDLDFELPYLLVYKSKNFIPKINSKVGGSSYTRNPTLSSSN